MKKKIPKIETINFVLRSNKTYQITFQQGALTIDGKIVWQPTEEFPHTNYRLKLEGTGPQNFRRRVKMRLRKRQNSKLIV